MFFNGLAVYFKSFRPQFSRPTSVDLDAYQDNRRSPKLGLGLIKHTAITVSRRTQASLRRRHGRQR